MSSTFLRWLPLAGLLALIAVTVPAAAEYYEGKPDCPPEQVCTLSAPDEGGEPIAYGPEDCIECSGPSDGGASPGDEGAGGNGSEPGRFGPDDCIDCLKPQDGRGPADCENCRGDASDGPTYGDCGGEVCAYDQPGDNGTCMDGADPREICDRDVQYLDGGSGAGPIESHQPRTGAQSGDGARVVPGAGLLAGLLVVGGVAALAAFGRKSR